MKTTPVTSLVAAAVLGVALAGCQSATTASEDKTDSAALSSGQKACVSKLAPVVTKAKSAVDLVAPTSSLDLSKLKGKTIWYITVSMNQFSTAMATGVKEAGKAAGVKVVTYDGQGTVSRFNTGIEQAVAQGAAGIILTGIVPSTVTGALAKAKAAGVKVLNSLNGDPGDPSPDGTYANLTSDFTSNGKTEIDWALADSGCKVDMVLMYSTGVPVWQKMAEGAKEEMDAKCPSCKLTELNLDIANVATDLPQKLQSALQKDPDVNYLYPVWDSGVPLVSPVVAAAGSKAKVISRDGLTDNLTKITKGREQVMTIAMPPTGWIGWVSTDSLLRAINGAPVPDYVIPTRLVDTKNVGDASVKTLWPAWTDYQKAFTDAWSGQ